MSAAPAQRRRAAQCRWWYGRDARASGPFEPPAAVPPHTLAHAPERARRDHLAGRYCAGRALARLGLPSACVGRADDGSPQWPQGIVGSITHTRELAWAVAARANCFRGVGIDAESVMSTGRARLVASRVATPGELGGIADRLRDDEQTALTLVFCAKEACFKCLYPHVGRRFDFLDVRVDDVDVHTGRVAVTLVSSLSEAFPAGTRIDGRYSRARDHILASLWIPARLEQWPGDLHTRCRGRLVDVGR